MSLYEIFDRLVRKTARCQDSRPAALRARLHLEALENRMAPCDLLGSTVVVSATATTYAMALSGD